MEPANNQQPVKYDFECAERFYSRLRTRISTWLEDKTHVTAQVREYLLLLPDLFALLVRLIRDPRIDSSLKVQLAAVSAYVLSPIDLIPDFLLPYGLADDVIALAIGLSRVVKIMDQAGEDILREHWEGEGDILAQIQQVMTTADSVLNSQVVSRLQDIFSRGTRRGDAPRS